MDTVNTDIFEVYGDNMVILWYEEVENNPVSSQKDMRNFMLFFYLHKCERKFLLSRRWSCIELHVYLNKSFNKKVIWSLGLSFLAESRALNAECVFLIWKSNIWASVNTFVK